MSSITSLLIGPGFFESPYVQTALLAGAIVACVSGMVGVFTVIRGQSFAGHALGDLGTLGGSASFLLGVNPLWGFLGAGVVVSAAMDLFGVQRRLSRDVATGIVLGAVLGTSALLLYFDTRHSNTTGATITILFGSLFALNPDLLPGVAALGVIGVVLVLLIYRPLLLSTLNGDLARTRGVPVRAVGLLFLVLMGVSVGLCSMAVGTILSPALLIGPAATALRLTNRLGMAMLVAAAIGSLATWLGILLAYDSYYWPPVNHGWPLSFFVVALILLFYVLADRGAQPRVRRNSAEPGQTTDTVAVGAGVD